MSNQKVLDKALEGISRDNNKEVYKKILAFYGSLSDEERSKLDVSKLHEMLFYEIEGFDGDLEIIYGFGNYDAGFKKEAEERIKECNQTKLICQFIDFNDVDGEEFVELGVRAIGSVITDQDDEIEALSWLKAKALEKGLYDDVVNGVKASGEITTVVCAALCFEPKLIDEVFGGKAQMYIYLHNSHFAHDDVLESFRDRLLTMDDGQLDTTIKSSVKDVNTKIKGRNI